LSRSAAGRLWKLRQRFGIAAPRVAIHTHIPWYWRWVGVAVLVGISAASAAWIYDAGRRFAGFDRTESESELARVKGDLEASRAELERVRAIANAADSRVSIERTAQQKLAQQIRVLEQENARIREELATLESMLSSDARANTLLSIYRFKVEPDLLPGEYRYHLLLLAPGAHREKEFTGRVELVVSLTEEGRNAMMSFPGEADAGAGAFRLSFKHFRRVEGTFRVSPKARVGSVQVRVYEAGATQPRATQTVAL
jgi:uncharacterized protein DUF6776